MRTIQEIKKSMTDEIMHDSNLVVALGLDTSRSWEEQTSSVSIINLLLYVVAAAHHIMERIFDSFKVEVEERIAAAYPGSISWMWNRAMEFQYDENANAYFLENGVYEHVDTSKQIIKYVAVIEEYNTVQIKVSGENYKALTPEQLGSFEAYMNALKFAGVKLAVSSLDSDDLTLKLRIWRNRLTMPKDDEAKKAIETAVVGYLNNIRYGGRFNKTRLMDAVQMIQGVEDVTIESCVFEAHDSATTTTELNVQNYSPIAGHINLKELEVTYE